MFKFRLRQLTATAMLTALSIILERILSITPASNTMDIRITFANIPIIIAGMLISPVMGAVCGVVSDLAGCIISGYAPFPILTAAPLVTGLVPALIVKAAGLDKKVDAGFVYKSTVLVLAVTISHILSSVIITTYGLSVMRGVGYVPMLITRIPSMLIGLVIDAVMICVLYTPLKKALKKQ